MHTTVSTYETQCSGKRLPCVREHIPASLEYGLIMYNGMRLNCLMF